MTNLFQIFGLHLPEQASTYAPKVDQMLGLLHVVMILIFVSWSLFFLFALIKFRQGNHPKADNNVNKWKIGSFVPDAVILVFELWLIFSFGLPIWAEIKEKFPEEKDALVVHLTAEQFAWNFQYAGPDGVFGSRDPKRMNSTNPLGLDMNEPSTKDDITTINQLYVPLNKPVIVQMTSKDVIHNFFVPEFRLKQDVVPGMNIPVWFQATKTGAYDLGCSQLCGLGHYRMKGIVTVVTPEEFDAKMKEIKLASVAE